MSSSKVLLAGSAVLVLYGTYRGVKALLLPLFSPLRHLPGPEPSNLFTGNLGELAKSSDDDVQGQWLEKFGRVIKFKWLFGANFLLTTDTTALSYILSHSADYQKLELSRAALATIFGEGLLVSEGEQHRRQRRIMNRSFGPASVRGLTPIFFQKAIQLRDILRTEITRGDLGTQRIEVSSYLNKATLDVIGLAGFHYNFNALNENQEPNELNIAFTRLFNFDAKFDLLEFLQVAIPFLRRIPTKSQRDTDAAKATMDRIGKELLRERKEAIIREKSGSVEKAPGESRKRDLLSVLVQANMDEDVPEAQRLSDEDVLAQVPTFLVAGHETTSSQTTWALFALAHDPDVQAKLRAELREVSTDNPDMDTLSALPYLDAVVRETLRLHAAVPGSSRVAMHDDVIPLSAPFTDRKGVVRSEIVIKKGELVAIPIVLLNRDKAIWGEDAEEFRPERWFNPPEAASAIPGVFGNMLTFLGGARSCIGYRFALIELKALLFTLIRAFEFMPTVPAKEIVKRAIIVSRPYIRGQEEAGVQMPLHIKLFDDTLSDGRIKSSD